jgi:23S rRNA-/tRNA-specific pseudouridylate synthase
MDPSPPKSDKAKPLISKNDAKDLKDSVLHRDEDVLVINKPSGLAVRCHVGCASVRGRG